MPQDKPGSRRPNDTPTDAPSAFPVATHSAPIFRVVEMVRDERGRLREEGRIWHTDIAHLRRFGRAVAANTASHRVVVTDAAGQVLEEIPVAPPEERRVRWDDWQDIPPAAAATTRPARGLAQAAQAAGTCGGPGRGAHPRAGQRDGRPADRRLVGNEGGHTRRRRRTGRHDGRGSSPALRQPARACRERLPSSQLSP